MLSFNHLLLQHLFSPPPPPPPYFYPPGPDPCPLQAPLTSVTTSLFEPLYFFFSQPRSLSWSGQTCLINEEEVPARTEVAGGGVRGNYNTTLTLLLRWWFCVQVGCDESRFNVSLTVRDKVTRRCPQTTINFPNRKDSRSGIEQVVFSCLQA